MEYKKLDQFYTKPVIAKRCVMETRNFLKHNPKLWIEPSAGSGNFLELLPRNKRVGIDLDPKIDGIAKGDFLKIDFSDNPSAAQVVIGNPPFGRRGNLAVEFFNHSAKFADTIAFILPVIFNKYFIHAQLDSAFNLYISNRLEREAFISPSGKELSMNCVFQVWSKDGRKMKNLRLHKPPATTHEDFKLYQYNNTPDALKIFNNEFDFAVPSQGWQDYSRRETRGRDCERHKQWMLIKAHGEKTKKALWDIDYQELAFSSATSVPGFRKNDLVRHYQEQYA